MVASVVQVAVFEQPARERIRLYHQQIQEWLEQPDMTIQQVQRLLEEQHELKVSYMSVYRYVRSHIVPLCKPVTAPGREYLRSASTDRPHYSSCPKVRRCRWPC